MLIANELKKRVEIKPDYLDNAITGDTFECDPETKETHLDVPKTEEDDDEQIQNDCGVFDVKGRVYKEFLLQGEAASVAAYYVDILKILRIRVTRVQKYMAVTGLLHHDNAPIHTSLRVREFLAKHTVTTLLQPHRPYLVRSTFFRFQR